MRPISSILAFILLSSAFVLAQSPPTAVLISPPDYPPLARQARIQGAVTVKIDIDKNGNVEKTQVLRGHPMLAPSTIDSLRNWAFECRAGSCINQFEITFKFVLSGKPGNAQVVTTLELPHTVTITAHPPEPTYQPVSPVTSRLSPVS